MFVSFSVCIISIKKCLSVLPFRSSGVEPGKQPIDDSSSDDDDKLEACKSKITVELGWIWN
jgi:hypothetical protein